MSVAAGGPGRRGRTLAAAAIVALAVVRAGAQETTGAVTGTVTDGDGRPLAGVAVRVTDPGTAVERETVTSSEGAFTLPLLPPGRYDVAFRLPGFGVYTVRAVRLHVGDRLVVDAGLGPAEVDRDWGSGDRAVPATAAIQHVLPTRQIEALPLINRHVAALVALNPGVTSALADEPALGLFSGDGLVFGGGRGGPSGWFLDGVTLAGGPGGLLLTPSLESLEEVRVVGATPSAAWPRGAAVALVTRSGTNLLRASAYELRRDGALDANSFFRNLSLDPAVRAEPADVRADLFGYTAGGPIRKDALFFFWSQEWRRRRGESEADALDGRQETLRVDHRASARWRLMGRYTHDALDAAGSPRRTAHAGEARATAALSATTVNEVSYRMARGAFREFRDSHELADNLSFQHGDHALALGGLVARASGTTRYEAYAQDTWRLHHAVTVDLGVRRAEGGWGPGAGVAWRASPGTTITAALAAPQAPTATRRFSLGVARRLYSRGALDVAYLGARAESLVHQPEQRYDGLLGHFRHEGPAGLLDLAYTLGRDRVRAGLDWDRQLGDRRHVFTATWARDLRGFTIAGITTFQSGPPARPITRGRGDIHARQVGDPFVNLPSDRYYFSPAAFAPAIIGDPGSPLSPFSLPGRNQWDVAVSRAFPLRGAARLQLRADVFNVFNHTQFTTVDTVCAAAPEDTTCAVPNTTLGQYLAARLPRQVQLGVKLLWN